MKFVSVLCDHLFFNGKSKFFTLHKITSFITSFYILVIAVISFYEFYNFQINQSSILEKARTYKFPVENLENTAISYRHMGYVTFFCLALNIILSYLSQYLSIKLFKAFKVVSKVLWFTGLLCCHALYLAIYSIIKIEENFSFLRSDMLNFSKKPRLNFFPTKILFLSCLSLEFSVIICIVFPFIIIQDILSSLFSVFSSYQSIPNTNLTLFSQAIDLFGNSFITKILSFCKCTGFNYQEIYVVDHDFDGIRLLQTWNSTQIMVPLNAVTYYKDDLFAPLASKIHSACNNFEIKMRCLVALFTIALCIIYYLMINKCKKSNAKCLYYELMNCQKLIYFVQFLFILIYKALLRRYQLREDDYLIKVGFSQSLVGFLVKMSKNRKESNLTYYTSAGAILSSSHSLIKRIERIDGATLQSSKV